VPEIEHPNAHQQQIAGDHQHLDGPVQKPLPGLPEGCKPDAGCVEQARDGYVDLREGQHQVRKQQEQDQPTHWDSRDGPSELQLPASDAGCALGGRPLRSRHGPAQNSV
jgi:hypothetical protein